MESMSLVLEIISNENTFIAHCSLDTVAKLLRLSKRTRALVNRRFTRFKLWCGHHRISLIHFCARCSELINATNALFPFFRDQRLDDMSWVIDMANTTNHPDVHYILGRYFSKSFGGPGVDDRALCKHHFKKAAAQGHAESLYELGLMQQSKFYVRGQQQRHWVKMEQYFALASQHGHLRATYHIARNEWKRTDATQEERQNAIEIIKDLRDKGDVMAWKLLGELGL
ncbi:uncharacterized protein BJ171DRAFT_517325 [Polychytrium aggregatum]|uniref:uncharacterized protein n=1 Tax=Polychytrium aggregatum TaxID=110093 RepID=UPI0022FEDB3D|nr:uncharacterized protein BJ171DRAFT_557064 [Polychytrium aggregatum]XP_052963867.1 uncharacterized protein BJ171DRAFT_517325 [Polychytrium aggregatum]KAI9175625.1 hypothetical protein BJ171DRAFT_557064 [Polychytrium aggregatum]KAI9199884.1 hypothetical protein BJ171DRAFT_517325 [Polychytrium aggregatum]